MALRWIEGFETWGDLNDTRATWGDQFYGKYGEADCDSGTPSLVAGADGVGLAYDNSNLTYNYFRIPFEDQPTWTVGVAYYLKSGIYYFGENVFKLIDGGAHQMWLEVRRDMGSGTHEIILIRGGTTLDSLGFFAPDQWLYIELQTTIHNSAGSYNCHVNGASVCSGSGVNTSDSGSAFANAVILGWTEGYYDNLYILDGTAGQNDFLGPVRVAKGMPTSDYSTQWVHSSGTTNYETVDDIPVNTSDYNYSKTTDDLDLFDVDSIGSTGIIGAQLNVDALLSDPGGKELILVCDSNAVQQTQSFQIGESDLVVGQALLTDIDPNTSTAWTKTTINAAHWGVKVG
jgi:hypothetical protein